MKYEECVKHRLLLPDHTKSILTSKEFASESKFISVAKALGKMTSFPEEDGEFYENPYKSRERRGRPPNFQNHLQKELNKELKI